jgi:hypothetical protein
MRMFWAKMVSKRLRTSSALSPLGYVDSVDPVVISYALLTCQRQVSYLNSVVMPDPVTADADEDSESD